MNPTSTRDKVVSQYISGCNPHLTNRFCRVELGLKPTSNTSNLMFHERTKHLQIDCHFIWEKFLSDEIYTEFVGSIDQLAYVLLVEY